MESRVVDRVALVLPVAFLACATRSCAYVTLRLPWVRPKEGPVVED